jgi:uncharacterized protein (TIGR00730 family)
MGRRYRGSPGVGVVRPPTYDEAVPDSDDEPEAGREGTGRRHRVPRPPDPLQRREPLPSEAPKELEDDPGVAARLAAIMASPSYRRPDQDPLFLERDDVRGLRLHLDYLKPELILREHGVAHTIVVFGSTRIEEPAAARRRVADLRGRLEADPDDTQAARRLAVAERLEAKSRFYDEAREFGRLVGAAGPSPDGRRIVLVTGGGPGIMEAANRGAFDVGAPTAGLNITLPHEQYPNPYITPELAFSFHYFAIRKLHFLVRARALVAFPGGYGTLDELFESLTLIQTRVTAPHPVVLVGEDYWRRAVDVDFLAEEGVIAEEDRELFWFVESAREAWGTIIDWHSANGTPLVKGGLT